MEQFLSPEERKYIGELLGDPQEILFYTTKNELGWLSNFYKSVQVVDDIVYWTNEHYYQSQKTTVPHLKAWIASAPTAYAAMMAGRQCIRKIQLVENWDEIKYDIMLKGLRAKFSQNELLKAKLLQTGKAVIHENSPTDMIWGIKGKDMLGKLIMQVREELQQGDKTYG